MKLIRAGRNAAIAAGLLALFVGMMAMPVAAADKGGPKNIFDDGPVSKPASLWTGVWVGIVGGYDMQNTEMAGLVNVQAKDFSYGVAAGADYQIKNTRIVVGIMLDYTRSNASSAVSALDGTASVVGRGGFLFSDTTLVYGLAGYTKDDLGNSATKALSLDQGFTVGLGVETYLAKNLSAKVEYRWVDEGSKAICGSPFCNVETTTQALRAGINWRF